MLAVPFGASARGLVPCGGYNKDGTREPVCDVKFTFTLVARATNWLIAMAGVLAVYEIARAALWLVISMGNEESITQNKSALSNAVVGFVLVLMAFLFVNTVVNFLLTRSLVSDNPSCKLDLTDPLNYLTIKDTSKCGPPDSNLHTKP